MLCMYRQYPGITRFSDIVTRAAVVSKSQYKKMGSINRRSGCVDEWHM